MRANQLLATLAGLFAAWSGAAEAAPAANVAQGANLFAITCSSSFCHGEAGIGARGPTLRNRDFPPDYVRTTMLNGRSGTPMPSFKSSLAPDEVEMIVAYVMSLSPNNHAADGGPAPVDATAVAIPLSEQAERGKAIFFDQARPESCGLCHSYQGKGGLVGADLSGVANQTAAALYRKITQPDGSATGFPAITVTAKDGKAVSGIEAGRTDAVVRLYDVSSAPAVLRSFYLADGIKIAPAGKPLHTHDLAGYSKEEMAALIAFLQSATGAGKPVSPQDFAQK